MSAAPINDRSNTLFSVLSFAALALSCAAVPGLDPLGPYEIGLLLSIVVLAGAGFLELLGRQIRSGRSDRQMQEAISLYTVAFLLSGLVGLALGNAPAEVARSVLPYAGFVFALLPWWQAGARLKAATLNSALAVVGLGQSLLIFSIFGSNTLSFDANSILVARVTQFDQRLTMPFTIAASVIGAMRAVFAPMLSARQILYAGLALLATVACMATQTRSQVLSILIGAGIVALMMLFAPRGRRSPVPDWLRRRLVVLMALAAAFAVFLLLFTSLGTIILDVLAARGNEKTDGRIDYEVIPALELYRDSGIGAWLFGVGAGTPFIDSILDERTYLHNLSLYALLYGGVIGFVIVHWLWWLLAKRLNAAWRERGDGEALTLLGVMIGMFVFAQFFAVHKILPFNLILWLAVSCVVTQPALSRRPAKPRARPVSLDERLLARVMDGPGGQRQQSEVRD
jgi:hypothetical protein